MSNKLPVACFAPPLTVELLTQYQAMIEDLGDEQREVREALEGCLRCVKLWWDLPESERKDGKKFLIEHRGQTTEYEAVPLEAAHVQALWNVTPWPRELEPIKQLFATIDADAARRNGDLVAAWQDAGGKGPRPPLESTALRDAAHHLLWHVHELALDREPLTIDKLG